MRDCIVVRDLHRDLVRKLLVETNKHFFILFVARAQSNHNHLFASQPVHDLRDEVEALLRREARNDADDGHFGIGVSHSEGGQKILFALGFAGKILRREFGGCKLVRLRTPLVVVHAVQNACNRSRAVTQYTFESKTVFRSLNLLTVLFTDRRDVVGIGQRTFEKVDLAEEFHLRHGEKIPGQHQQGQRLRWEQALIAHVVNGKNGAHIAESRVFGVHRAQQHRHQRRLPVVTMGEQREALGIVGIVARGCSVKSVALEELGVVNKIEAHSGLASAGQYRCEPILVVEGNGDAAHHRGRISQLGLPVAGQINAHLMAQRRQGARQCSDYVR